MKTFQIVEENATEVGPFASEEEALHFYLLLETASRQWHRKLKKSKITVTRNGLYNVVTASRVTGVVPIGKYELVIVPKYLIKQSTDQQVSIWSKALLQMLAFSGSKQFGIFNSVSAQVSNDFNFIDLIAQSYLISLTTALAEGLPRGYVKTASHQVSLRGRLLINQLYPRIITEPHLIPCEYNTYIADTPIARLLKWATLELAEIVTKSSVANRLKDLSLQMPEAVPILPPLQTLNRLSLSAQYQHCESAMRIAMWIAHSKGSRYADKSTIDKIPGILLDSDQVFENFVLGLLKRICVLENWEFRREELVLGSPNFNGKKLFTIPDGQIWKDGIPILVLDAKYKPWKGKPTPENTYQIMAGGRILNCDKAILIYPLPGNMQPLKWNLLKDGNPKSLWAVFLDPSSISNQNGLANITESLATNLKTVLKEHD